MTSWSSTISMLSVTAMSLLPQAVRDDTRLILVGDPHQLVSVEAARSSPT